MKTILVTGANGQLGNELRVITGKSANNYVFTDVAELDITDAEAVDSMVKDCGAEVIVNCAAYTNVDKAEDEPELSGLINAAAVRNLARAAKKYSATLIHVSTDYVFGGTDSNTPLTEEEPAAPLGIYGKTKLQGEQAVEESGCNHIIIRTAWLYSEYGRNFLKTMLGLMAARTELNVVFDQAGSPTYAYDLAKFIFDIIENGRYVNTDGVYHYSNEGVCSWFDFAKMIAEYSGNDKCVINPCHSCEYPAKVTRPSYSVLDKTKIKKTFGISVPYWTDSLRTCIQNLQAKEDKNGI